MKVAYADPIQAMTREELDQLRELADRARLVPSQEVDHAD